MFLWSCAVVQFVDSAAKSADAPSVELRIYSSALALAVRWPEAATLAGDSWVRVEGPLQVDRSGPDERPFIEATQVSPVPRPINPYLSPTG